jgi:hypothetical protein
MTTYTLNITQSLPDDTTNWSVTTTHAEDLARLLQLSGCDTSTAASDAPTESAFQTPAMQTALPVMEQQAAYDYGHRDPTQEQDEFQITDYNFKGRADVPERVTHAGFGSNPLRNDMKDQVFEQLKQAYEKFLQEDTQNEAGVLSPLTTETRPEFAHDPLSDEQPHTDGSRSPLSRIIRQQMPT